MVLTAGRERPSEGDDMQRVKGWQLFSWVQQLMHGREPGNSGRHGIQEQSQHACRWEKG